MEKTLLRSVIVGLNPDQEISVVFRGSLSHLTGDYTVVETRRGRGKGGSRLADLRLTNDSTSEIITIGTPRNDDILNITVDGTTLGYASETEVPANYDTDAANAVALKEQFKTLMNASETRPVVEISAPQAPEVSGIFTVVDARQLRGRSGQIVLVLQGEDGTEPVEVWSYRHSGVVQSFTVLSD